MTTENPLFVLPAYVRLANAGMSFYDPLSHLQLNHAQVKEVKVMTPLTVSWLQGGGLVRTSAPAAAATSTDTATTSTQETASAPTTTTSATETATTAETVEDVVKNAAADLEKDLAAIQNVSPKSTKSK